MPTGDSKLDAFESLFRSAVKEVFELEPPTTRTVLVLLDDAEEAAVTRQTAAGFLSCVDQADQLEWFVETAWATQSSPVIRARETVERIEPDLVVTRRHLLGAETNLPHTLGAVVDVLTQATDVPILLLPPPGFPLPSSTDRVMVLTDHLAGDARLVNYGVDLTHKRGKLFLAHLEDGAHLERVLDAIDKIPSIDSEEARRVLPERLLRAASEYIDSVVETLRRNQVEETVVPLVQIGHGVKSYQALMADHDVDLLVFNTKDAQQDAMHAMAYALAVQIRSRPLLLL